MVACLRVVRGLAWAEGEGRYDMMGSLSCFISDNAGPQPRDGLRAQLANPGFANIQYQTNLLEVQSLLVIETEQQFFPFGQFFDGSGQCSSQALGHEGSQRIVSLLDMYRVAIGLLSEELFGI